jgi:hypothetical protein
MDALAAHWRVNNGRTNVVWQNAYLDQKNEFVIDRMPYPLIQMNPQDMADIKVRAGDLVEIYNENGSTQAIVYMRGKALRSKLMIRLRQLRAATITLGSGIQARVQRSPRTAPHSLRAFGLPRRKWQAWRRPDLIRERRLREMRPDRVGAILHIFIDPVTKQEGNLPQKCGPAEWMQTPDG